MGLGKALLRSLKLLFWKIPHLKGKFPITARAKKGFARLRPSEERDPIPRGVAALFAAEALYDGDEEAAAIAINSGDPDDWTSTLRTNMASVVGKDFHRYYL